jgi:hypothetical protein
VIARRLYLGGLSILTALISTFIVASVAAKVRGLDITCACFGPRQQKLELHNASPARSGFARRLGIVALQVSDKVAMRYTKLLSRDS